MMPTNKRIGAWPIESADGELRALIVKWGQMHAVRTALGLAATAAYLVLAAMVWALIDDSAGPYPTC